MIDSYMYAIAMAIRGTTYLLNLTTPKNLSPFLQSQKRWMTRHRRVQDRSKNKRVHDLEIATEKYKVASKVIYLMEVLKQEPEQIIPIRSLEQHRRQINLPKPNKISDFLRKLPKLFELYKDQRGITWCGFSKAGEDLVLEEERVVKEYADKAAEHVTKFLMMSVDKRLPLDKVAHFRRDFGMPFDFRKDWIFSYPKLFRVVKDEDDIEFLELVSWDPRWAVTELEKKRFGVCDDHKPGLLALDFPMKYPSDYKKVYRYGAKIDHFQKREYLSPYAEASGLTAGSLEFDKRAVAVMHELLSFTIEKKLVTDHLTHFRSELVMPQRLMRLLLKHFGIFYVSERGKRFSVFLTEAYEGSELIEKCPLVLWKEKVLSLIGYRGKKKKIATFEDFVESEDEDLFEERSDEENVKIQKEEEDTMSGLDDRPLSHESEMEMEIGEICREYIEKETS